jgi:hypothetical protein
MEVISSIMEVGLVRRLRKGLTSFFEGLVGMLVFLSAVTSGILVAFILAELLSLIGRILS